MNQHVLGADHLQSSSAESVLGVLLDTRWNTSQQCALAAKMANGILGCLRRNGVEGGDLSPPLGSGQLAVPSQFLRPQFERDTDIPERT